MKTNVSQTSLSAFDAMAVGFASMQAEILGRMAPDQIYSRRQLAQLTKIETSSIAGRVNELIESGEIEVAGKFRCPVTGRMVEAVKRTAKQKALF